MMKKPHIIANWKMNLDLASIERFFNRFDLTDDMLARVQTIICPSFVFLDNVRLKISQRSISLGAQNIFWEERGAYTGEVSACQAADVGAQYVLVGHSERRGIFNESDKVVNKKVLLALKNKIIPVICLGENLEEKEAGLTKKIIEQKVQACLEQVRSHEMKKVIIAYEPVWALSTTATNINQQANNPEETQVIHKYIRKIISELYDQSVAKAVTIIYGGSVKPDNINGFIPMDDIDGVLPGAASNEADSFKKIITAYIKE